MALLIKDSTQIIVACSDGRMLRTESLQLESQGLFVILAGFVVIAIVMTSDTKAILVFGNRRMLRTDLGIPWDRIGR